jgi:hypothetical protein
MKTIRSGKLPETHPDYPVIKKIEDALARQAGGMNKLISELPPLIRQAIDEVIDTIRTGRVNESELEKTEKTYIGTKMEILIRNYFRLPKGILDLQIDGMDVDVKNTLADTWMIPREAVGKPCILVASDEKRRSCYFGIFIAKPQNLTAGKNQDQKHSVSAAGFDNIHWLLANATYPDSFWSQIGAEATHKIMRGQTGNERVGTLFREVQRKPIHRDIIQAVAQQKDYMKRLRKNGGARDQLAAEGLAVLSGNYDAALIKALRLGTVEKDEFLSVKGKTPEEISLISRFGKLT